MATNGQSSARPSSRYISELNGQSTVGSTNGNGLQNGKDKARAGSVAAQSSTSHPGPSPPTYYGHDREEITRLLIQALSDLGYSDAASSVIRSSGFALESQSVANFRHAVLDGNWAVAEELLLGASIAGSGAGNGEDAGNTASSIAHRASESGSGTPTGAASGTHTPSPLSGSGLILVSDANRTAMRFALRQQKYLEFLEACDIAKALHVLRTELTPLYQDTQKLHFLSSLLMCQSPMDLRSRAGWDGASGQSRRNLLSHLSTYISPSVMLPEHRLSVLLDQVKYYQISACLYHTDPAASSLYADHYCDRSNFPSQVLHELDSQSGEVWQVRFSHDGRHLASCGSGRYVVIWDIPLHGAPGVPTMVMRLDGHAQGVGDVAWSPDDSMLISCGRDGRARLWDTRTGLLVRLFDKFEEPISCCVWTNDGQSIVLGSFDKDRALCRWNVRDGERMYTWTKKHRTEDLALSPNGQWLVAMDHERRLHIYNFLTHKLEFEMELSSRAVSVAISQDSNMLLVNRQDGEIHMYDLHARGRSGSVSNGMNGGGISGSLDGDNADIGGSFVRRYLGATGGECVIRCGFGGANESFVVSGSEDGNLNIWHKNIGVLLFKIEAHKPRCNALCWSPTDPCLFATCGDDNKIKLWSNAERVRLRDAEAATANGGRGSNGF